MDRKDIELLREVGYSYKEIWNLDENQINDVSNQTKNKLENIEAISKGLSLPIRNKEENKSIKWKEWDEVLKGMENNPI